MLMPYAKGFVTVNGVVIGGLFLALLATVWCEIQTRGGEKTRWMSKPHIVSIAVCSIVSLSMVILGLIGYNSTLATIADYPVWHGGLAFCKANVICNSFNRRFRYCNNGRIHCRNNDGYRFLCSSTLDL